MRFNPLAMMGQNPVAQLMAAMQNGGNADMIVQQALRNNPQAQQIIAGKTPAQLMQTAENMCRERGTSVDEVLGRLGIQR